MNGRWYRMLRTGHLVILRLKKLERGIRRGPLWVHTLDLFSPDLLYDMQETKPAVALLAGLEDPAEMTSVGERKHAHDDEADEPDESSAVPQPGAPVAPRPRTSHAASAAFKESESVGLAVLMRPRCPVSGGQGHLCPVDAGVRRWMVLRPERPGEHDDSAAPVGAG